MDVFLFYLFPIIFVLIFLGITYFWEVRRSKKIRAIAQKLGWQFHQDNRNNILPINPHFRLTAIWYNRQNFRNILFCRIKGKNIYIFENYYYANKSKNYRTGVLIEDLRLQLPDFSLEPDALFLNKFGQKWRKRKIFFDSHPRFSENYLLLGEDEDRIRQLFNEAVLFFYETQGLLLGIRTEVRGKQFLVYRRNYRYQPEEMEKFLADCLWIFELFDS
ncbi:hypothetical protein [Oscillatoria salina]|uniref:hypothetical protein n=1 Tax=Oscillatoria salina TaxID=331517 RepID=UPI001CCEE667|nr:hypothetical protein [Oscillatoria salina]MBZ8180255.1 hypothetical protein [Oscillatoria salina IIICB1]